MAFNGIDTLRKEMQRRGSFLRSVAALMTGSACAQLVPLAAAPILTRMYTPHEFGVLAAFLAIGSLVSVVATARYEMAVMLPREDREAHDLVALSLTITVAMAVLSAIGLYAARAPLARWLGSPGLSTWLALVPVFVLAAGVQQTFVQWNSRRKAFGRVAQGTMAQAGVDAGFSLACGAAGFGPGGLVLGAVMGRAAAAATLSREVPDALRETPPTRSGVRAAARRYADFPGVNIWHAFAFVAHRSALHLLISAMFGPAVLGLFAYAVRNARAPLNLVAGSVAQVFFQRASRARAEGKDLGPLLTRTMAGTAPIGVGMLLVLLFAGPWIFGVVLGPEWTIAGEYARRLSPMLFLSCIDTPVSTMPIIVNRQRTGLALALVGQFGALSAFALMAVADFDFLACITAYSGGMTLYRAALLLWYVRIGRGEKPCAS